MTSSGNKSTSCVILYSGGTDSTCTAALMAQQYPNVHLLTFYQGKKRPVSGISTNIQSLENKFSRNKFVHKVISTTELVKFISYDHYGKYFLRHGWLVLSTCGFTSLSWHMSTIVYCLEHTIDQVADGLTMELLHFPGHMDDVIELFRSLYASFGICYSNPVRTWAVPPDRKFIDRLIVDQHGFLFPSQEPETSQSRTTGKYLFDLGIMTNPDVKGSSQDHRMQYDCYPFVLYNIMVFWIYLNFRPYEYLCVKMRTLFKEKTEDMRMLLSAYAQDKDRSRLSGLLDRDLL